MLKCDRDIRRIIEKQARFAGVKLYDFVNVGNHIHILAKFHNRVLYKRFIRSITGLIARRVLGAQRGAAASLLEILKDWDSAFTERVLC